MRAQEPGKTDVFVVAFAGYDGQAVFRNGRLPLAEVGPRDVREALDEAGIRWRVVIASACFAGVCVPPLRDDRTLVLTAADEAHSSFGCDDERKPPTPMRVVSRRVK